MERLAMMLHQVINRHGGRTVVSECEEFLRIVFGTCADISHKRQTNATSWQCEFEGLDIAIHRMESEDHTTCTRSITVFCGNCNIRLILVENTMPLSKVYKIEVTE